MKKTEYEPFIENDRIFFVPLEDDIDDNYLRWVNDRKIVEYLDTGNFPKTRHTLIEYVKSINESPKHVFFAVIEKKTGKYIGNAKLGPIDWINRTAVYGRMIGEKSALRKGYGTEMSALLLHYAFMIINLNKVTAGVLADNKGSIKSNEKNGLYIEGKLKDQIYNNGIYKDVLMMGITKSRYLEIRGNKK